MSPPTFRRPVRLIRSGFALISVLAVIVVVTIVVVAYLSMARTERAASQNFCDHDRAKALGVGMLNRILAGHATPLVNNELLAPFKLNAEGTGLPSGDTIKNYFGLTTADADPVQRQLLQPIYEMAPDDETVFDETGLVRTSKPASKEGEPAYTADFWAYDGLTEKVLGSPDAQPRVVPQWVDYYETDATGKRMSYRTGEMAFAIWDEGGKLDINMAGEDKSVNGMSPSRLLLEQLSSSPETLLSYLNGNDQERQRSNFGLRRIASLTGDNEDKGDDRWFFSVRELVAKGLIDPAKFRQVTTVSRDFDTRPEWDGDRTPKALQEMQGRSDSPGAETFLRSYINNPVLFGLFDNNGAAGPTVVKDTLDQTKLEAEVGKITGTGASESLKQSGLQILRLLAILRRALPRDSNTAAGANILMNQWSDSDIWAIGLNLIQATAPASDHNLSAFKSDKYPGAPYDDPDVRLGLRISPYVTEDAIKLKKISADDYEATEYIEIWNPFPFRLLKPDGKTPIKYRAGSFTTGYPQQVWPLEGCGLYHPSINDSGAASGDASTLDDSWKNLPEAPEPGHFTYVKLGPRKITAAMLEQQRAEVLSYRGGKDNRPGFEIRLRAYVLNTDYYGKWTYLAGNALPNFETVYYSVMMSMPYHGNNNPLAATRAYIPPVSMPQDIGSVAWYSFQIDDPRMGAFARQCQPSTYLKNAAVDQNDPSYRFSWRGYLNKHSIDYQGLVKSGYSEDEAEFTPYYNGKKFKVGDGSEVAGYNANFGANWPGADPNIGVPENDSQTFAQMMSTFALPGRPFLNIGELGTVFANRPWTTLSFANTISPLNPALTPSANALSANGDPPPRPSILLDYFTTIGTPTALTNLNFRKPGPDQAGPGANPQPLTANLNQRYQDLHWLFESVQGANEAQIPMGNLRPIRGRINLNTASREVLTTLLAAPYRMPASIGLQLLTSSLAKPVEKVVTSSSDPNFETSDYWVTIKPELAEKIATLITLPLTDANAIRPFRNLSDLSRLYDQNKSEMEVIHKDYAPSIISAMIGRLAQFGTVRQQSYTIDLVARSLNPMVEKRRAAGSNLKPVVTAEVRLQARVFFDSFSRKAFIESFQYR